MSKGKRQERTIWWN